MLLFLKSTHKCPTLICLMARHGTAHAVAFITFLYASVVESGAEEEKRV